MTKTKQKILKEFEEKFYVFYRDYNIEFKGGNFTGRVGAKSLGKKLNDFLSQALDKMREETIEEINDRIMNWFEGHQEVTLEDRLELRGLLKELKSNERKKL